jgi:peptide chain release factor subunit 1
VYIYIYVVIHPYCNVCVPFLVPPNGLVIYCGTIVTDEGKEKKVNIDFEPFKPINTSLYLCDNKVGVIGSESLLR